MRGDNFRYDLKIKAVPPPRPEERGQDIEEKPEGVMDFKALAEESGLIQVSVSAKTSKDLSRISS